MSTRIPNFNTFSTIIDRLSIENVKLSHFEFLLTQAGQDELDLQSKISLQLEIIELLKKELEEFMFEAFRSKNYSYIDEERTFK
jgi:hypothetical protein